MFTTFIKTLFFFSLFISSSLLYATTYTVTNNNDSGIGSFRQAILDANANAGSDIIEFSIAGAGTHTIGLLSVLPTITDQTFIDGWSQGGVGYTGAPLIVLNGTGLGAGTNGLYINIDGCTIRGLVINNFATGIRIEKANTIVYGNYIGTDDTGTGIAANSNAGIYINSSGNQIGSGDITWRNIISGNQTGIIISGSAATGNKIQGNYIGTDVTGTTDLGNTTNGIYLSTSVTATIIGTDGDGLNDATEGNVISGNNQRGIYLQNSCNHNTIAGNLIGTDNTGSVSLANSTNGIEVNASAQNVIGGSTVVQRNIISGNTTNGIYITGAASTANKIQGNYIGTDINGTTSLGNQNGINLATNASLTIIGTDSDGSDDASEGNVVSGSSARGIYVQLSSNQNTIAGNYVGTDKTGTIALGNSNGVELNSSAQNLVGGSSPEQRNIISGNNTHGVIVTGSPSTANKIQGNYIGTNAAGTADLGNNQHGIYIKSDAYANIAGTDGDGSNDATEGNLVSGNNSRGVSFFNAGIQNIVAGNLIGVNYAGTSAIANSADGIEINSSPQNTIGGSSSTQRNIISGNTLDGIYITGAASTANTILGNYIGTDINGTSALSNSKDGIYILSGSNNQIGGTGANEGNTIAFNSLVGISIASGTGNSIRRNSIFSNGGIGIDLGNDGVTLNDSDDSDAGANNLQNFPVITSAPWTATDTETIGSLNGSANTTFTLDFFYNASLDPSGYGEGMSFIGSADVTTDASGNVVFDIPFSTAIPSGTYVTATATDPSNNTSEFSGLFSVPLPVTLIDFTATAEEENVLLSWEVAEEKEMNGYVIEASNDGQLFDSIGFIPSLNTGNNSYHFVVGNEVTNMSYYRLKMKDENGEAKYSIIKSITNAASPAITYSVFPNPTNGLLHITIQNLVAANATISISDLRGRVIYKRLVENKITDSSFNTIIDLSGFESGIYIATIVSEREVYQEKVSLKN